MLVICSQCQMQLSFKEINSQVEGIGPVQILSVQMCPRCEEAAIDKAFQAGLTFPKEEN